MEKDLRALGLDHYESKAVSILISQKLTLKQLSDKANIPFGKIYSVIKQLKNNNIVKETNSRPKLVYIENASETISHLIDKKKEKEEKIIESLQQSASEVDKAKGNITKFFQIGTTVEENRLIQLRTFTESKKEVLQVLNIHHKPQSNRASKTLWEKEIIKSIKGGVVFKAIYPEKIEFPKLIKKINKENPEDFQIKRFNTDFPRFDLIDNNKVLIKLVQQDPLQFGGVLFIENEKLNKNLRNIFYEMWDHCKEN